MLLDRVRADGLERLARAKVSKERSFTDGDSSESWTAPVAESSPVDKDKRRRRPPAKLGLWKNPGQAELTSVAPMAESWPASPSQPSTSWPASPSTCSPSPLSASSRRTAEDLVQRLRREAAKRPWTLLRRQLMGDEAGEGPARALQGSASLASVQSAASSHEPSLGPPLSPKRSTGQRRLAQSAVRAFLLGRGLGREERVAPAPAPGEDGEGASDDERASSKGSGGSKEHEEHERSRLRNRSKPRALRNLGTPHSEDSPRSGSKGDGKRRESAWDDVGLSPRTNTALRTPKHVRMKRLKLKKEHEIWVAERQKRFNDIPKDESGVILKAFAHFDEDGDGLLGAEEVMAALREMGLSGATTDEKREILKLCEESMCPKTRLTQSPARSMTSFMSRSMTRSMTASGKEQPESQPVDVMTFALDIVPVIRVRLSELQGNDLRRQFFQLDKKSSGRLPKNQCVEIARMAGVDQRLMWEEIDRCRQGPKDPFKDGLDFEEFQELFYKASEKAAKSVRERQRQIKEATRISEEAFKEFRPDLVSLYDIFTKYDIDDSGSLDLDEVMMSMSEFGISPGNEKQRSLYEEVVMEFDTDGNQQFDFEEFLHLVRAVREYRRELKRTDQLELFQRYDRDDSGSLSVAEISRLLVDMGCVPYSQQEQEELGNLINSVDEDGSGTIDFDEFEVLSQRIEERLTSMRYEEDVKYAMSLGFTEVNLRDFKLLFEALDSDGSKKLDAPEVLQGLRMMDKRAQKISKESFQSMFSALDEDGSGSLDFREFVDLMRLVRDGEGLFASDGEKLAAQAKFLDPRTLRTVLEIFKLSKAYIMSLPKDDLVEAFCSCFNIQASDNLHKRLNVRTVAELCESARKFEGGHKDAVRPETPEVVERRSSKLPTMGRTSTKATTGDRRPSRSAARTLSKVSKAISTQGVSAPRG